TRRLLEGGLRVLGLRHIRALEAQDADRVQVRYLRGLLHAARRTPFGLEHDFSRIRTVADFHRLVPPRSRSELQRCPACPLLRPLWLAGWRSTVRTLLGWTVQARPGCRLLQGECVVLAGSDAPLEGLPVLLKPFVRVVAGST